MSDASVMTWSTAGEAEEPRVSQEPQVVHPWSRLTHHQHLFFYAATWAALWFPRTFICPHRLHLVVENFPPADEAAVSLLCFHLHPGRSPWVGGLTRCRWTCDWWHGVVPALTRQNVLIWRMSKKKKVHIPRHQVTLSAHAPHFWSETFTWSWQTKHQRL